MATHFEEREVVGNLYVDTVTFEAHLAFEATQAPPPVPPRTSHHHRHQPLIDESSLPIDVLASKFTDLLNNAATSNSEWYDFWAEVLCIFNRMTGVYHPSEIVSTAISRFSVNKLIGTRYYEFEESLWWMNISTENKLKKARASADFLNCIIEEKKLCIGEKLYTILKKHYDKIRDERTVPTYYTDCNGVAWASYDIV
jgi:hypothetical protein